jgi:hypothetical protein
MKLYEIDGFGATCGSAAETKEMIGNVESHNITQHHTISEGWFTV